MFAAGGCWRRFSVRPMMLADLAVDLVTRHPLATIGAAFAAGFLSWVVTRARTA